MAMLTLILKRVLSVLVFVFCARCCYLQGRHHRDAMVDLQLGSNYSVGITLKHLFGGKAVLDDGWLLGAGIAYGRKLNNYFRLLMPFVG